ncbi:MAG: response regulator, partial [Planctomycetia bacterium]|nr:response regulator [Planctomycetia bacterium]
KILSKPVDLSQLASTLDEALQQPLILVVDDDQDLCANLRDLIQERGYRVALADDIRSAMARLDENRFGIVLLDVRLPDGDGRELLNRMRDARSEARAILITGQCLESADLPLGDAPSDAVCYKPLDLQVLFSLIGRFTR